MAKMLLMDGPAIAYRSHYAMARSGLTAADGQSTAATYGYTSTLMKLLRTEAPDYVCVAFDTDKPTYRHELFDEYKAGRPEMPDDLANQLDWIRGVTEGLGIRLLAVEGFEADDIIGTLVARARQAGVDVVIATGDKDMLQLVDSGTRVLMLSGWGRDTAKLDEKAVVAKYGITPDLLPDYFALMGDAVDNIKGVPGIGPKTAGILVKQFGRLEEIYENLEGVEANRVRKALSENRDAAFSSRELVTIHKEVPLSLSMEDLRRRPVDGSILRPLFHELGFRSLARQVIPEEAPEEINPDVWKEPEAGGAAPQVDCGGRMGIEINLDGNTAATAPILGVSICCEGKGDYYFPLSHREPGNVSPECFRAAAGAAVEDASVTKIVHDAKRVMIAMRRLGLEVRGLAFDTLLAAYLVKPGQGSLTVEDIAADYLGQFLSPEAKKRSSQPLITMKQASERCGLRARTLLRAAKHMEEDLESKDLWRLYSDVEMPLAGVLAEMELRGVKVDRQHLTDLSADLEKRMFMAEKDAYALAGRTFNLNSPRDVSRVLFEEIGLRPRRKTKTGFSTDMSVLMELSAEHELPKKIVDYRQIAKLKTAHVDQLIRFADPDTDRIHANFHQAVTATGRLSSSDPNLQNVPIRGDLGGEIRKAFIPSEPGWVLVSADYSQIELRIVAHLSGDENLIGAFTRGEDIHSQTAAFIFKVEPAAVRPEMRTIAKAVNFGIIYGMGVQSLARNTGLSNAEAAGFLKEHRNTYPGLYSYIDKLLEGARETGWVETVLGRKRFLSNIRSGQQSVRSAVERMAINTPVQGSAADIIKIAMLDLAAEIKKRGLKGAMLIQVHDEILVDCPASEHEEFEALLREKMRDAYSLAVPLKVEVNSGRNWYEAH
jgi:DNA polymerase-1